MVVDAPDLGAHLEAQLGVQVGERLVHQHQRRLDHDGARDRHALLLSAGKLAGQLVGLLPAVAPVPVASSTRRAISAFGRRRVVPGRRRCSAAPSCAGTARSSGTPCRSRVRSGPSLVDALVVQPDRRRR